MRTRRSIGVLCGVFLMVTSIHPFATAWAGSGGEQGFVGDPAGSGGRDGVRAALQQAQTEQGGNPYEKLASLFDKGTVPTEAELTGCFSGRWVCKDTPEVIRPGLLVAGQASPNPDGGPLFGTSLFAIPRCLGGPDARLCDAPSPEDIAGYWAGFRRDVAAHVYSEVRLSTSDRAAIVQRKRPEPCSYSIRKSGSYLVVQAMTRDGLTGYGYYFRRLQTPVSARTPEQAQKPAGSSFPRSIRYVSFE